ncbi:hypothetical protein LIER_40449 [Lithospermum erythrorhizon]|uniref:Integrase zinc-binding domain-containing protein n=1 Tax=Lithospermum erythrorhizon TaxID=34254 RepID=A0AAV3QVX1_LITER
MIISTTQLLRMNEIQDTYLQDQAIQHILAGIIIKPEAFPPYQYKEGILKHKWRIVIEAHKVLKSKLIRALHDSTVGGHSGMAVTYNNVKSLFYWKGLKKDVTTFVSFCDIYQKSKHELVPSPGLLNPVTIPTSVWSQISMNFVEGLPKSRNMDNIHVVVDSHKSDGQTERVNQSLETNVSLKMTPFEALYGYKPPILSTTHYLEDVNTEEILQQRRQITKWIKQNLQQVQSRMKMFVDTKRTDREFVEGDLVYLKLQPYRQNSLSLRKHLKLAVKYYGPFKIIQRIGPVEYKRKFPETSRIHPVFHVSLLKKCIKRTLEIQKELPETLPDGSFPMYPVTVLNKRTILRNKIYVHQLLIQWKHSSLKDATCALSSSLHSFP